MALAMIGAAGGTLGHIDAIGHISLMHAPMEEPKEDADAILLPEHPQALQLVVLGHIPQVVLQEIVDVLAEEVQVALGQDATVRFGVHYELQEQHEEQVEGLEAAPVDLRADPAGELEEPVGDADTARGHRGRTAARVQVDAHLREDLDFVQVGLVQLLGRHLPEKESHALHCGLGQRLPPLAFLRCFRREGVNRRRLGRRGRIGQLLILGPHGRSSPLVVLRGRFGDLAGGLRGEGGTLPSCFCLMWVKSAA